MYVVLKTNSSASVQLIQNDNNYFQCTAILVSIDRNIRRQSFLPCSGGNHFFIGNCQKFLIKNKNLCGSHRLVSPYERDTLTLESSSLGNFITSSPFHSALKSRQPFYLQTFLSNPFLEQGRFFCLLKFRT